jgi:hypothetical protein
MMSPSVAAGALLPRSALSSPQLSQLFASPERARKLSDEEKRCVGAVMAVGFANVLLTVCVQSEVQALDHPRARDPRRRHNQSVFADQSGARTS